MSSSAAKPLTREDLRERLRRREIAPVYTLFGAETYLRDLAAKTIVNLVFGDEGFRDFNETEFSLNVEGNLRAALAAADQLPMMAERRVVKITEVRVAAAAAKDTVKEADEAVLARFLEDPPPSAVVIFVADELSRVRRIGKMLAEKTVAVEFARLDDAGLEQWTVKRADELGAELDRSVARHLAALAGPDVRRLTNEVQKLATAALPEKRITHELVEALVVDNREAGNFALADMLVSGDRRGSLRLLRKLVDDGAEPLMILGLLALNFRRLLIVKDMMDQGRPRDEAARILNLRYREQERFFAAARRTELKSLKHIMRRLADTDLAIKTSMGGSGTKGAQMHLEILACEILSAR